MEQHAAIYSSAAHQQPYALLVSAAADQQGSSVDVIVPASVAKLSALVSARSDASEGLRRVDITDVPGLAPAAVRGWQALLGLATARKTPLVAPAAAGLQAQRGAAVAHVLSTTASLVDVFEVARVLGTDRPAMQALDEYLAPALSGLPLIRIRAVGGRTLTVPVGSDLRTVVRSALGSGPQGAGADATEEEQQLRAILCGAFVEALDAALRNHMPGCAVAACVAYAQNRSYLANAIDHVVYGMLAEACEGFVAVPDGASTSATFYRSVFMAAMEGLTGIPFGAILARGVDGGWAALKAELLGAVRPLAREEGAQVQVAPSASPGILGVEAVVILGT